VIHADNPDLIVPKPFLSFWITIPYAEHLIPRICQIWPSDFWIFGYLKGLLQGSSVDEPYELLSATQEILNEVDLETLDAVFREWMIRLQKCIDGHGEYAK
jgi:hypothetical protein